MSGTTTLPTTPARQVPISEAARLLKVSRRTVERRHSSGTLEGQLKKLGNVTGERDYLRNALAAALTRPLQLSEKAESLDPRSWWRRVFG